MTQRVKEFIEDYIDEIELGRWEDVFDGWYNEAIDEVGAMSWDDADKIAELFRVLQTLDVTPETTMEARKAVIEKHAEDIVNKFQRKYYNRNKWYIKWSSMLFDLNSALGFNDDELYEIFNELDLSGVTPDKNNERFVIESL